MLRTMCILNLLSNDYILLYNFFLFQDKFKALFSFKEVKEMASTTFKKRPNHKRTIILLCLAITSLFIFAVMSEGGSLYLYLRLKFGWTLKQYTLFSSVRDLASIFGTVLGIYVLHKILKVNEIVLILMGLISCFNGALVLGLASTTMHIYFGKITIHLCIFLFIQLKIEK